MRTRALCLLLVIALAVPISCTDEPAVGPVVTDGSDRPFNAPPQYYSNYWGPPPDFAIEFEYIDTVHGEGVHVGSLGVPAWDPDKGAPAPLGLTFDVDGTMYMILNWLWGPAPVAELVTVDRATGEVTLIAQYDEHFCGAEIDACGNMYSVGFDAYNPWDGAHAYFGDGILTRFDKVTGAMEEIGFTGIFDFMDLAFDSDGTLWGTTDNKLYTISTADGSVTFVTEIHGVPPAPPGELNPMEVMSITFDKHDILYGTAIVGFWGTDVTDSPILRIDVNTGQATVLGMSTLGYNHGGDNYPSKVDVCHLKDDGTYVRKSVSMFALATHMAHGDIVPGAGGNSCNCP